MTLLPAKANFSRFGSGLFLNFPKPRLLHCSGELALASAETVHGLPSIVVLELCPLAVSGSFKRPVNKQTSPLTN